MSVGIDNATVTQVAQRHEITRQQIYKWRHELKGKGLWSPDAGALFLPIDFEALHALPAPSTVAPSISVELSLANGRCLVSVRSDCPACVMERVIVSTIDSGHLEVGDGGEEGFEETGLV